MRAPVTSEASPATTSPVSVAKRHCRNLWEGTSFPFPSSALIARPSLNQEPGQSHGTLAAIGCAYRRASHPACSDRERDRLSSHDDMWFKEIQCRLPHNQSQSVDDLVPVDLGSAHTGDVPCEHGSRKQLRTWCSVVRDAALTTGGEERSIAAAFRLGGIAATRVSRRACPVTKRRVFFVPFACILISQTQKSGLDRTAPFAVSLFFSCLERATTAGVYAKV